MDYSQIIIAGRLGQDASVSERGEFTVFRMQVATKKIRHGEIVTCWHPVKYSTSSKTESAFLREHLVTGATVLCNGVVDLLRREHPNAPVDITVYSIDADRVQVESKGRARDTSRERPCKFDESDSFVDQPATQEPTHVRESNRPQVTAPLPPPPRTPSRVERPQAPATLQPPRRNEPVRPAAARPAPVRHPGPVLDF